jgi:MFS family permease
MRSNRLLTIFLFVQGLAIGHLSKHYTGRQLMLSSAIAVAAGFALWGVVPNLWTLLIVLVPFSFGGGILNTGINSALSKSVYPEEIGGTLGVSASIESLTRVLSPVAGGLLLQWARPVGTGALHRCRDCLRSHFRVAKAFCETRSAIGAAYDVRRLSDVGWIRGSG